MKKNEIINWTTWNYENNAPYALVKMSLNHAISVGVSIFLMSFVFALFKFNSLEHVLSFWGLFFLSAIVLTLLSVIPLLIIHTIHYIVFKRVLLHNKIEYSVLVAWFLVFLHYQAIYHILDYILDILKYNVSVVETIFLFVGYMMGMFISFLTFQKSFYVNKINNLGDNNLWKTFIDPASKYFD